MRFVTEPEPEHPDRALVVVQRRVEHQLEARGDGELPEDLPSVEDLEGPLVVETRAEAVLVRPTPVDGDAQLVPPFERLSARFRIVSDGGEPTTSCCKPPETLGLGELRLVSCCIPPLAPGSD
jgi:hypothetical protein